MATTAKGVHCLLWIKEKYGIDFYDRFNIVDAVIEYCEQTGLTQKKSDPIINQDKDITERLRKHRDDEKSHKVYIDQEIKTDENQK